jgi:hypothetical protein
MAQPTRPLAQAGAAKPLRYVKHESTDIRKTFEKFRRLQAMQQLKSQEGETK